MTIDIRTCRDDRYRFVHAFDLDSGFYYRSGVHDLEGRETDSDPFMASFPHLLDVGIMGHCQHGESGLCLQAGVGCYQDGLHRKEPNMRPEDFFRIIDEAEGRLFQVALGGRGDPEMHEAFEEIVCYAREHDIVPNLTTSGYGLTPEKAGVMARMCGAVAVSWYRSEYTLRAIETLQEAGVQTNIHFVLGGNTIDEAIRLLESDGFPHGVERVVFLLHKPVGLGRTEHVLKANDERVRHFFSLFREPGIIDRAGFDSCTVPGILNFDTAIDPRTLDTCEAARFSAYIAPDMTMMPCSFDQDKRWGVSLRNHTIEEAWNHAQFERFRSAFSLSCPGCERKSLCLGGCPIVPEIVLCPARQEVAK